MIIYDQIMWLMKKLLFIFQHTNRWEHWLIHDGWLFIFIAVGITIYLSYRIFVWLSKYIYFHPIYLCPEDEKDRKRYLGRRLFKIDRGGFWYKRKIPEAYWEDFQSLIYYWNGGIHKFLVPDSERKDMEKKVKISEVCYYIYYKGMKRMNDLSVRKATNDPVQSKIVDESFFYDDIRDKMERTDDFGEKAVRSNAESQFIQLERHSIPISKEDYPDVPTESEESMRVERKKRETREDKEKEKEISEDFLKERIDEITEG